MNRNRIRILWFKSDYLDQYAMVLSDFFHPYLIDYLYMLSIILFALYISSRNYFDVGNIFQTKNAPFLECRRPSSVKKGKYSTERRIVSSSTTRESLRITSV
ncbi:unnamed protein product [Phytomonas sp. EM1]|nr:unnamed protein product [Phytomonas sp. EM1]|eukprot:CCW62379.1 unnamed protein product [Phytomonas sp. isolate EM1]